MVRTIGLQDALHVSQVQNVVAHLDCRSLKEADSEKTMSPDLDFVSVRQVRLIYVPQDSLLAEEILMSLLSTVKIHRVLVAKVMVLLVSCRGN